jgi:hypothetical protein
MNQNNLYVTFYKPFDLTRKSFKFLKLLHVSKLLLVATFIIIIFDFLWANKCLKYLWKCMANSNEITTNFNKWRHESCINSKYTNDNYIPPPYNRHLQTNVQKDEMHKIIILPNLASLLQIEQNCLPISFFSFYDMTSRLNEILIGK